MSGSPGVAHASPAHLQGKATHGRLLLRDARPTDRLPAGALLREALTPQLADSVFGLGATGASRYFERLFQHPGTLWSYDITTLAELDGEVVGLVSHAPWAVLAQRRRSTLRGYWRAYGLRGLLKLIPRIRALMRASPAVPPDHWFIPCLAVAPEHRGNGVAHALLQTVYRQAEAHAPACSLYVPTSNATAREFYDRAGYVEREGADSELLQRLAGVRGRVRFERTLDAGKPA
ncbi:MAG: N-acetyltransferase [Chloroflexi bacterium]|nr:N-acetyltransferase [Chloroflexota bacterium]